ncbi:MAG: phage major capsid protein [Acidobacteriaceae bacterium]
MLKKLRQRKADAVARMNAILNAADTANRDLTDAERTEYDGLRASLKTLNEDITRAEELQEAERSLGGNAVVQVGDNRAEKKPWRGLGEQLVAQARSQIFQASGRPHMIDPRIQAALGTSETVPSDGGFLVEPEYNAKIMQRIYETGEVAKRVEKMQMKAARTVLNAVDEDSRADGSRWGGILSYWLAEAQTYSGTKPKFREVQLIANKLIALIYATEELLEDTDLLESYVDSIVPQELAFQLDEAIINGTGAGQPQGVLNSPSTIVQPYASGEGSSGTGPSTTDILAMYSRLFAPYRKNAVWFINQSIEPSLLPLTLGSPSLGQYLIYTPAGINGNPGPYGRLFGLPVVPVEQSAAVGTQGDIVLFAPQGYLLAMRNEMRADSSIHVAFLTGEKAFRFMLRADGQPWWKKPLQPYASSAPTLSSCVILQTR